MAQGIPAIATAYLEVWVEGGAQLWTRTTKAKDPEGMYFAASGYMKRHDVESSYPTNEDFKKWAAKL